MSDQVEDMEEEVLECSSDILENLSRLRGYCIVCGSMVGENLINEIDVGYILCACGNIVMCANTNKWH